MKVSELISEDLIIDELKGGSKVDVLREFSDLLYQKGKVSDREGLIKVLIARESLGSTGIGDGVAIPHGKLKGLKELVLAFGRSTPGVDFDSLDGAVAHLFFLLLAPEDAPGEHLKALARISRIMKNKGLRDVLMKSMDKEEIKRAITAEEGGYTG